MSNILITSAGKRVSLLRAFQKEAGRLCHGAKLYCCDVNPMLSAACQAADGSFKVPRVDHPTYADTLLEKCKAFNIALVIPTIDTELLLLSKCKEAFAQEGIHIIISSEQFITITRDKRLTHKFFEEKGIHTAREYDLNNYSFPMFIKPYNGSRSVDTYLVRNEKELKPKHLNNDRLMLLEYLDHQKHDEYTCDLYYDKSNTLKCAVPRKRIEVRDGEVNKGVTCRNELELLIRKHLEVIPGASGCLTAQFFMNKTTGKITGIEINARFGGGFPLTYLSGANYPGWIIREYLLKETISEQFDCWEDQLLMLRYDHEILVHGYRYTP